MRVACILHCPQPRFPERWVFLEVTIITVSTAHTQVPRVIDTLLSREGLARLPLYAMGFASGGAFVLNLAAAYPRFQSICAMAVGLPDKIFEPLVMGWHGPVVSIAASNFIDGIGFYPPTVFVSMPRDNRTAQIIIVDMERLRSQVRVRWHNEILCFSARAVGHKTLAHVRKQ